MLAYGAQNITLNLTNQYAYMPFSQFSAGNQYNWPPLVLDLDGNGVDLTLLPVSVAAFDTDGSGALLRTAWMGGEDGLLVIDLSEDGSFSADGVIDRTREVSFASWADTDGPERTSDIRALAAIFDSDANGALDDADAHFADFRVWRDANHDGVTQDGELFTLSEMGIVSVGLGVQSRSVMVHYRRWGARRRMHYGRSSSRQRPHDAASSRRAPSVERK